MNEIGVLFSEAKDACIKLQSQQSVTSTELESLFRVYGYEKEEGGNFSTPVFEKIINAVNYIVENVLLDFLVNSLKNGKGQFIDILLDDIKNSSSNFKSILSDPCSRLPDDVDIKNEKVKKLVNDLLKEKINAELINSDFSNFESLDTHELQNILNNIESANDINIKVKNKISSSISSILFGKVTPELEEIGRNFQEAIEIAIKDGDTTFDAGSYKKKFKETVRNIENDRVVRGSDTEKLLEKCKTSFESQFDKSVGEFITSIIEGKLTDELENLDNEVEIDNYIASSNSTAYSAIKKSLKEIDEKEIKSELEKKLDRKIKDARIMCRAKPPKVKIIEDDAGNEYAVFKTEQFPVAHREQKRAGWKIEPKRLSNGNVLITFKNLSNGKVLEPNDSKRLRSENPYELTVQEWKELERKMRDSQRKIVGMKEKINELRLKYKGTKDESEKMKIKENLDKCIEEISHYVRVSGKLKIFDRFVGDYIQNKVPDFDPDSIKITPEIMENLRELAECSHTQLKSKSGGLIIEGEAGVGKNVLIDIFAHFTNRPVFVFACGKKTDAHDLTYQWILDENGSKKLNSKVYEAIRTPGAILVLDEINTLDAGVIKTLNGLFDKRRSLVSPEAGGNDVKALDDVLIFGTMNPVSYSGTQKIPQDVSSRFHFITHDYDWLFDKNGGVSYSDALRTYGNVNYFWKLVSGNGMRKQDVKLYELALLDKRVGNKLSKEKQEILERFKPISDNDFIRAWNQLYNLNNEQEVLNTFGSDFVQGMKDIYTIVLYSNYIRLRHKMVKENIEGDDLPWHEDTNELFDEKSFSPRLAIQALEQLHNGNEVSNAKQAVIQTYVQQISDVSIRSKIIQFLNNLSEKNIETQLKSLREKSS